MKSLYAFLRNIVAPTDAAPGEPQTQFGADVPTLVEQIVQDRFGADFRVATVTLHMLDADHYWFVANCYGAIQNEQYLIEGHVGTVNLVVTARGYSPVTETVDVTIGDDGGLVGSIVQTTGDVKTSLLADPLTRYTVDILSVTRLRVDSSGATVVGTVSVAASATLSDVFQSTVGDQTIPQFIIQANGWMVWGPGDAAADTNFRRTAARELSSNAVIDAQLGYRAAGVDIGRGIVASAFFTSDSGSFSSEGLIASLDSVPAKQNRVYRVEIVGRCEGTSELGNARFRARDTNTSGATQIDFGGLNMLKSPTNDAHVSAYGYLRRTGSDTTKTLAITLECLGSGTAKMLGSASAPWGVNVIDVGHVDDWSANIKTW